MNPADIVLLINAEIGVGRHQLAPGDRGRNRRHAPVEARHRHVATAVDLERRLGQQRRSREERRVGLEIEVLLQLAVEDLKDDRREQRLEQDIAVGAVGARFRSIQLHCGPSPLRPGSADSRLAGFIPASHASLLSLGGYRAPVTQGASPREPLDVTEAIRLLNGGADEVFRGISLVDSAAAANDAQALERRALLEAIGCARPQSWERSLDSLEQAAEQGFRTAQEQLRILARAGEEARDWTRIRSSISIEQLLRPPQKRALSERPRLRVLDRFATPGECEWLVKS